LKQVRRALSSRGAAIVASPNPDAKLSLLPRTSGPRSALGYYELYDAVSAEFAEVKMLGQTPFVGYAVVDFAPEGEPEVSIDSSLLPGGAEEPEWFVALAGREALECDPVGIVQLPAHTVTGGVPSDVADQLRVSRSAEARLLARIAELELEAAALRKEHTENGAATGERVTRLERELAQREAQIADLQARAVAADARDAHARDELATLRQNAEGGDAARRELQDLAAAAKRAELEKKELRERVGKLSSEVAELEGRRAELTAEAERLAGAAEQQRARAAELEQRLAERDARIAELASASEDSPDDLTALETALAERGEHVQRLSGELRESERVGRELLRELGHAREAAAVAEPLSAENARLKANLEALAWTVEELEGRLSVSPSDPR
jgi:hypothetical protein